MGLRNIPFGPKMTRGNLSFPRAESHVFVRGFPNGHPMSTGAFDQPPHLHRGSFCVSDLAGPR